MYFGNYAVSVYLSPTPPFPAPESVIPLPPLDCLRFFEAAARHRSFVRDAEELGVTPPAVAHRIRQADRPRCSRISAPRSHAASPSPDARSAPSCRPAHKPHKVNETVTVHYRFRPLAGTRATTLENRSHRGEPIVVVADSDGQRYHLPLWMTAPEAAQWGCVTVHVCRTRPCPSFVISLRPGPQSRLHRRQEIAMKYPRQERLQRTLMCEPQPRVTSAVWLLTRQSPRSLRVQRMRSPAQSSMPSARVDLGAAAAPADLGGLPVHQAVLAAVEQHRAAPVVDADDAPLVVLLDAEPPVGAVEGEDIARRIVPRECRGSSPPRAPPSHRPALERSDGSEPTVDSIARRQRVGMDEAADRANPRRPEEPCCVIDGAFDRMGGSSLKRIAPGEHRFTQIDRDSLARLRQLGPLTDDNLLIFRDRTPKGRHYTARPRDPPTGLQDSSFGAGCFGNAKSS